MTGRRGALVHALGAIDMALWDIAGQGRRRADVAAARRGAPGGRAPAVRVAAAERRTPTGRASPRRSPARRSTASRRGFRAAKLELLTRGPYRHSGLSIPDDRLVEVIAAVREATGPGFAIMVDVGYGWDDWHEALAVIETWDEHDVFFVETPLWTDDLDGYAELVRHSPDSDRGRRVARDAPRVRGLHGARRARRAAARRRPRRRPHARPAA